MSKIVLVIEDDVTIGCLLTQVIRNNLKLGCIQISDAESAFELLACESSKKNIALIVSDIILPGMTGLQMAAEVESRGLNIPILLISSNIKPDGDIAFLQKPFTIKDFISKAEALLVTRTDT